VTEIKSTLAVENILCESNLFYSLLASAFVSSVSFLMLVEFQFLSMHRL
jgi:hypothetical protein